MRDESGMALMIALLLIIVMSAIAISAVEHSGEDSAVSGRLRRATKMFHAADGGIQIAVGRVNQASPDTSPFTFTTTDGTTLRTGARSDTTAQPLAVLGSGPPPDGFCVGVGAACYRRDLYRAQVSALAGDGAASELEAQFGVLVPGTGGY
jgi:Tfp pilus assembly protein PilX